MDYLSNIFGGISPPSWNSPDPKIEEANRCILKACGGTEKIAIVSRNALFCLIPVGVVSMAWGAPIGGTITLLTALPSVLLLEDVRKLCEWVTDEINDKNNPSFGSLLLKFQEEDFSFSTSAETLTDLYNHIDHLSKSAKKKLSPLGALCLALISEVALGTLQIVRSFKEKSVVIRFTEWLMSSNDGSTNSRMPNLDLIRQGIIHLSRALRRLAMMNTCYFGTLTLIGILGVMGASSSIPLSFFLSSMTLLLMTGKNFHYDKVQKDFITFVAIAAFLFGAISVANLGVKTTGAVGCLVVGVIGGVLSWDLKQLAENVERMANEHKNLTAIFSGWGIAGIGYLILESLPYLSSLINKTTESTEDKEDMLKKIVKTIKSKSDELYQGMSPLGKFLLDEAMIPLSPEKREHRRIMERILYS